MSRSQENEGREKSLNIRNNNRWATLKQMPELYPAFTAHSLKNFFAKDTDGIRRCILRIGRKILIDTREFEAWIDSHKDGSKK